MELPDREQALRAFQSPTPDLREALLRQIEKDLQLETGNLEVDQNSDFIEKLASRLEQVIAYFMEREQGLLAQALYRVDLSEGKLNAAMASGTYESLAQLTARLILEREMQKVFLRWWLKNQPPPG